MNILITGAAGFIGAALSLRLLNDGHHVSGIDNLNDYYDVNLKKARLARLSEYPEFKFIHLDLADRPNMAKLFEDNAFDCVVNLAAQAGCGTALKIRHPMWIPIWWALAISLKGAAMAGSSILCLLLPVLCMGSIPICLFRFAIMWIIRSVCMRRLKKANELMAHTYSYLYNLPTTGLRFFTVYGPWGRPDMALFLFTKAMLNGEPIKVFNNGEMQRDFTYIDDIVEGVVRVMNNIPTPDPEWSGKNPVPSRSCVPYRIYNIGNNEPVALMDFVRAIEEALGKKAKIDYLPMQAGDVPATWADVDDLIADTGFKPSMSVKQVFRTLWIGTKRTMPKIKPRSCCCGALG